MATLTSQSLFVEKIFVALLVGAFGLVIGSFLGAVSYRLPRGICIATPPSMCPLCQRRLTVADLIPVFSQLFNRSRCRHCGGKVPWRYAIIEILTCFGFVFIWLISGHWTSFVVSAVFYTWAFTLAVIDIEHLLLPDKLNFTGALAGFCFAACGWAQVSFLQALYGALLGYGLIFVVVLLSRGGMGMGDAKFLAMIGTFVGPVGVLLTLFGASALGAVVGMALVKLGRHGRREPIPFGPFLAFAAFSTFVFMAVRNSG